MRKTQLHRGTKPLRRVAIRRRSKETAALYADPNGRRAFVGRRLTDYPWCQVKWENCTGRSQDVHEWWSRGTGGAIVPGDKATRQQQRFVAVCRRCHGDLDLDLPRARSEGWVR